MVQGTQYKFGDFQVRMIKVVPNQAENLRGILMEVTAFEFFFHCCLFVDVFFVHVCFLICLCWNTSVYWGETWSMLVRIGEPLEYKHKEEETSVSVN